MVPWLDVWQLVGLGLVALAATVGLLWLSGHMKQLTGVLIRLLCPADVKEARIRVGKDPDTGKVAVLWCDRFPHGPVTCDRACFTDEIAGSIVS